MRQIERCLLEQITQNKEKETRIEALLGRVATLEKQVIALATTLDGLQRVLREMPRGPVASPQVYIGPQVPSATLPGRQGGENQVPIHIPKKRGRKPGANKLLEANLLRPQTNMVSAPMSNLQS